MIHLRIKDRKLKASRNWNAQRYGNIPLNAYEECRQDPFFLLRDVFEHIFITYDEEIDSAIRIQLENAQHRLQAVTRQLCKL